ncbi:AAA family ATPase [Streptomyces sp. G44]|uniref:AAA family ATPase n=1 Tax=Streptomyces sp. G44 TaxID=2807632 RepID=UPI001961AEDE|nr:ATP-binding protein [Streptomyces sp. G44]MBM7173377.1 AAA family ATPase [Streptomyces sp. G44]
MSDPGTLPALLDALRGRVAELVERRGSTDPTAADPLRGLYVTRELAHRLATAPPRPVADLMGRGEPGGVLGELAGSFGLSPLDQRILLAACAPDVDRRFEPLYGYLNDDVGRRRATVALALDLAGTAPHDPEARARFHPLAPLRAGGLLALEDEDRPLPGRALRVPERVVARLLGGDTLLDTELVGRGVELLPPAARETSASGDRFAARLAELAAHRALLVHLRERRDGSAAEPVADALRAAGLTVLRHRPAAGPGDATGRVALALLREARLRGAAVVVGPLPDEPAALVRFLATGDVPVVFVGSEPYDPTWAPDAGLLVLDAPPPDGIDAAAVWRTELARHAGTDSGGADLRFDLAEAVAPYRLGAAQIRRAARAAANLAAFDGTAPTAAHVQSSARLQSAPLLDKHARRIRPQVGFADLVLPEEPLAMLRELAQRARHRDKVLGEWRLRTGGGRGRGVVALFAGDSGTGKTLSAEVVAGELGLDLYVVDLSAVVDKYVGETEKNLERIFAEADRTDAVLLFDEADAVFGKRSEVKSSHDRYANLESAYLLQRLEAFDGIAVLTTNLRSNIDDAFTRRLDLVVDFPFPDVDQRVTLWRTCLSGTPCAPDLDAELARCAKEFELAGGGIRSAAVTAAYLAAGRGGPVCGADVRAGARREYRKMGRLEPGGSLPWQ